MNKSLTKTQSFFIIAAGVVAVAYVISTVTYQTSSPVNSTTSDIKNITAPVPHDDKQSGIKYPENRVTNKTAPSITNGLTTAQIVTEWSNRVVLVGCFWKYSNGQIYRETIGSGTLFYFDNIGFSILTNRHVLIDQTGLRPTYCGILFQSVNKDFIVEMENIHFSSTQAEDIGWLALPSQDPFLAKFNPQNPKRCNMSDVTSGDDIVILGYPGIGAQSSLTATKGIISATDGPYYLTDAKIEHGNSGGAAIQTKNDCYLGIPTASMAGELESVGRILRLGIPQ